VGDRDIFKSDVELLGPLEEVGPDSVADGLTLGDELSGVELGYNSFEDFVSNRGKNTFIVVLSEALCMGFSQYLKIPLSEIIPGRSLAAS
jgi:hypothetical protein